MFISMSKRLKPAEVLAKNLQMLIDETGLKIAELSRRSGVSERMIRYILDQDRTASIDIVESLAAVFKLDGWHLVMPGLKLDLARTGKLQKLIGDYSVSSSEGREYIERVAEHEARYGSESSN